MTLYNMIGHGYAKTRAPDDRITNRLVALLNLPPNATVLDVGAGTGKYARAFADRGYSVIALEPSEVMQAQSEPCSGVRFVRAAAESIPLPDNSVDGAIVVLAVHHFENRPLAFREIIRVVGDGPVVVFTFDPSNFDQFWLSKYFPAIGRRFRSLPAGLSNLAEEIGRVTSRKTRRVSFPLPPDLQDSFGAASWSCPEAYLRPEIRNGISDFALMRPDDLESGLESLAGDLKSGRWDLKYGALRTQEFFDAGYRFIIVEAKS
ncbi:MAG TPA: class I SAM-dependent methyltransferase [Chthoniobacteraceae bacterium]|nr:class I SAM-dependent methyltransferase [Chthoniobacteraceae bacterium]